MNKWLKVLDIMRTSDGKSMQKSELFMTQTREMKTLGFVAPVMSYKEYFRNP